MADVDSTWVYQPSQTS